MAYYRECPTCGAHLDPGERCMECAEKTKERSAGEDGAGPDKIILEWKTPARTAPTPRKVGPYTKTARPPSRRGRGFSLFEERPLDVYVFAIQ